MAQKGTLERNTHTQHNKQSNGSEKTVIVAQTISRRCQQPQEKSLLSLRDGYLFRVPVLDRVKPNPIPAIMLTSGQIAQMAVRKSAL